VSVASTDQFGRRIEYLRISVTDRCNFRCAYCMPLEGLPWLPRAEILSYEEITEVVRQLAPLGVSKLRITGGEPTIRPQLSTLIAMLRAVPGIEDIALSTNGVKLPEMADELKSAGLDRVNMSADSLRPERIREIARRSLKFSPLDAASAAECAGLGPVKINMVVMRGINDDEIEDFARLTIEHPWHVRFIELMPVGEMASLTMEHVVPSDEILARLSKVPGSGCGITPMSHTYCGDCNRVRLTADGRLRTCLYGEEEVSFRDALRAGEPLAPVYAAALATKPKEHALLQMRVGGLRALSQVGG
jgi:GTP 3',8-cyclase